MECFGSYWHFGGESWHKGPNWSAVDMPLSQQQVFLYWQKYTGNTRRIHKFKSGPALVAKMVHIFISLLSFPVKLLDMFDLFLLEGFFFCFGILLIWVRPFMSHDLYRKIDTWGLLKKPTTLNWRIPPSSKRCQIALSIHVQWCVFSYFCHHCE